MKILCVEDGSVDLDEIEKKGLKDGGVLVYRQGSSKPFVLEVDKTPYELTIRKKIYDELLEKGVIITHRDAVRFIRNDEFTIDVPDLKKIVLGELNDKEKSQKT